MVPESNDPLIPNKSEKIKLLINGIQLIKEQIKTYEELFFKDMSKEREFANKFNIFFKVDNSQGNNKIVYLNVILKLL